MLEIPWGGGILIRIGSEFSGWRDSIKDYKICRLLSDREKARAIIIATYDSFILNRSMILDSLNLEKTLLIADEVHKFGSENRRNMMPEEIRYRIGLSATPKRAFDDAGTKAVFDYFCPLNRPYVFGIADAIAAGYLCPYNYYPILVEMSLSEYEDYQQLSDKIARLSSKNKDDNDDLTRLYKQRHRIIENASNKENSVGQYFEDNVFSKDFSKTIIFCPEGKTYSDDNISVIQTRIWEVFKRHHKRIRMAKYIQGTPSSVLESFSSGRLDMLLAKKRLDEGIDIASTKRALFVSSSTAEREFIQRRGRVLRLAKGKRFAEIVDFIVVPPSVINSRSFFFQNELTRFLNFAENALNKAEALLVINNYMGEKYAR